MKPILFVVGSATSYRLQRVFAEFCVSQGRLVAFLYDQPPDALFAEVESDARRLGARVVSLDEQIRDNERPTPRWSRMPHPLRARFFALLASPTRSIMVRILGARVAAAQRVLDEISPAAVLVSEDGISGPAAVMAAARSLGLPVVDLPYGYGTQDDLDIALEEKQANNELLRAEGWLGRLIALLAPAWIKKGRFAGAIIFPPGYIAAREALGMTLRNAWIVHGGYADRLLAESEQMVDLYRSEGLPEDKLALTGSPYCDTLHAALQQDASAKAAFRSSRSVEPGKLRILVSWPPSYHASRAAQCEFPTYEEMSRKILGWLNSLPGCQLTVSLHPAMQGEVRADIERLGLEISEEYVIDLIPKHDLYVSYYSSTIRWAIASGKPVVNYDAYGLGLDVYAKAPGFFNAPDFAAFKREVSRLTATPAVFEQKAAQQSEVAARWGLVDGGCMPRMLAELDRLSADH